MKSRFVYSIALAALSLGLALGIPAQAAENTAAAKAPTAWMRSGSGPIKALYAEDITAQAESFQKGVNKIDAQVKEVKFDPDAPKDEIEKQFKGSLSLERHQADVNGLRDRFVTCMAAMEQEYKTAEAAGKLTPEQTKQYAACQQHCEGVLKSLDALHRNTARLRTATRREYFLDAWDEHKKLVESLHEEAAQCPQMFGEMAKITSTPT